MLLERLTFCWQNVGAEEVIDRWWAWLCSVWDVAEAADVQLARCLLVVRIADVTAAGGVVAMDARLPVVFGMLVALEKS